MSCETPKTMQGANQMETENQNGTIMSKDTFAAVTAIQQEIHAMLQLPAEDLNKVSRLELQLDWKPVLTVNIHPKNS
ncbi:hypothetical protein DWUX_1677 [Desulfovibrio diazotrophicus]|nr:hypothetical protein DWUX_1677 [Desulfovibrio diazotrophicus]